MLLLSTVAIAAASMLKGAASSDVLIAARRMVVEGCTDVATSATPHVMKPELACNPAGLATVAHSQKARFYILLITTGLADTIDCMATCLLLGIAVTVIVILRCC